MLVEEVLDLLGADVLALADDDVFEATGDADVSVLVEHAEVPGAEEPLFVEGIGIERLVEVARASAAGALARSSPSFAGPRRAVERDRPQHDPGHGAPPVGIGRQRGVPG